MILRKYGAITSCSFIQEEPHYYLSFMSTENKPYFFCVLLNFHIHKQTILLMLKSSLLFFFSKTVCHVGKVQTKPKSVSTDVSEAIGVKEEINTKSL